MHAFGLLVFGNGASVSAAEKKGGMILVTHGFEKRPDGGDEVRIAGRWSDALLLCELCCR